MPKQSSVSKNPAVAPYEFVWRDKHGIDRDIKKMDTVHLFWTVRMIWNHFAPMEMRMSSFKRHDFAPFYTTDYMYRAIHVMMPELLSRTDAWPEWEQDLSLMRSWYERPDFSTLFDS